MIHRIPSRPTSRSLAVACLLAASSLTACGGDGDEVLQSDLESLDPDPSAANGAADGATDQQSDGAEGLVVFVTSTRQSAALGGPAGADELCAARAAAASLEGTFKAWLSTADTPVADRLDSSSGPYVRTDGVRVADHWEDLLDGSLQAAISVDEMGGSASGDVWTGTLGDGSPLLTDDCGGFTLGDSSARAQCGNSTSTNAAWTENLTPRCSVRLRVYCFEQ